MSTLQRRRRRWVWTVGWLTTGGSHDELSFVLGDWRRAIGFRRQLHRDPDVAVVWTDLGRRPWPVFVGR